MWKIDPKTAIGPVRIGMTQGECERVLGPATDKFNRFWDLPEVTLAYEDQLLHVTLSVADRVKTVSAFRPREVLLSGIQLLGRPMADVKAELEEAGLRVEHIDVGLWCEEAGIVLVEVDEVVDAVELSGGGQA